MTGNHTASYKNLIVDLNVHDSLYQRSSHFPIAANFKASEQPQVPNSSTQRSILWNRFYNHD